MQLEAADLPQPPQSCLVIGGTGFVGSALAAQAAAQGWSTAAVGRADYALQKGRSFDLVINANGNASRFRANREPLFDLEASVLSVQRALVDFPDGHFVLISTVDVYNDPTRAQSTAEATPIGLQTLHSYGFHKRLAELLVSRQRGSWQIFRLAQMVGAGLRKGPFFDLLHGQPLWIDPQSQFPVMSTQCVAQAIFHLVEKGPRNEVFNVCGRGSVSVADAIGLLPEPLRNVQFAARELQRYCINTDKVHAICPLPDSRAELASFLALQSARARPNHA